MVLQGSARDLLRLNLWLRSAERVQIVLGRFKAQNFDELFETALMWGSKLAAQAPLAVEQIKLVSHAGDLDQGIEAEKQGFATAFRSEDAKEGIGAFLGKRTPRFKGA